MRSKMKFLVIALLFLQVHAESESGVEGSQEPYVQSNRPFTTGFQYTYRYEANLKLSLTQSTGVKVKSLVTLDFVKSKMTGATKTHEVKLTFKDTSIHTVLADDSLTPGQLSDEDNEQFERSVTFLYENGEVGTIWFHQNEPAWISNIKRGVINMLNLDVSRQPIGQRAKFSKTEETIFGKCDCNYTISGIKGSSITNISKEITGGKCEEVTDVFSRVLSLSMGNRLLLNWEVLKIDNDKFKILTAKGVGSLPNLQTMKNSHQSLVLVQERKSVPAPFQEDTAWIVGSLKLDLSKQYDSSRIWLGASRFDATNVHDMLVKFSKDYNNMDKPITAELATYISNVIQWLRTLDMTQLNNQWEACMSDSRVRELFLRIFSLVRTSGSVDLMSDKIRFQSKDLSARAVEIFLDMFTMQNDTVELPIITQINDICQQDLIRQNENLEKKCLMTFVALRQKWCQEKSCGQLPLPTKLTQALEIRTFETLNQADQIQYLKIAESSKDLKLVKPLMEIINMKNIPIRVRKHAILALRPMVNHVRSLASAQLLAMVKGEKSQELRQIMYLVLLDTPTPTIIHSCTQNMKTEESITIRRFVYESLLSIATIQHGFFLSESQKAARSAIAILVNGNLVPENLRWLKPLYTNSTKPHDTDLAYYWKIQSPLTNDSLIPKDLFARFDMKFFGHRFNIFDLQIESDGMQEFIAQMAGIPTRENQDPNESRDLTISGHLKVAGQQWMSESKTMKSDHSWTKLAKLLHDGFKHDTKGIAMPFDTITKIPTAVGLPLVLETSALMLQKMENFVQTRSPSLLNIPNFFFGKMNVKSQFVHKERSLVLTEASLYVDSPLIKTGIHLKKISNISIDGQINMKMNVKTKETTTDFELPKLPEFTTSQYNSGVFNIDSRNPTDVAFRAKKHARPRVTFKVRGMGPQRYLSVINKEVVLSNEPHSWEIIREQRLVFPEMITLYSPEQGYLVYDPSTDRLKVSEKRRGFFQIKKSTNPNALNVVSLKAYLDVDSKSSVGREDAIMVLKKGKIVRKNVQAVYLKYEESTNSIRGSQDEQDDFIKETPGESFGCFKAWVPYCIRKVFNDEVISVGLSFPKELEKIRVRAKATGSMQHREYSLKFSLIGKLPPDTIQVAWSHDTMSREFNMDVSKGVSKTNNKLMCFHLQYPGNNVRSWISFDASCQNRHFEVYSIGKRYPMPYSKQFKMVTRWDDTLAAYVESILSASYWKIKEMCSQSEWIDNLVKLFVDTKGSEAVVDGHLYLSSPKQIRLSLNNTRGKLFYTVPLPTSVDRIPYGTYRYPFLQQVGNMIHKPVCMHQGNVFKTFDNVRYTYDISNKCEHVMVKTCSKYAPSLQVLVKEVDTLKHIRIKMDGINILITPTEYNVMPQVKINDLFQDMNSLQNKIELPNGMSIQFHWIQETQSLFVINDAMGMELKLVAGRSIYARFSNLMFGQMCGLCGDMNSEQNMEMMTPELIEVTDSNLFGWSWIMTGKQCKNDGCSLKMDYQRFTNGQDECTTQVKIPQCFEKKDVRFNKDVIALQDVPAVCGMEGREVVIKRSLFSVPKKCYCMV